MPDWFYRPVAQPLLFRLPDGAARTVALGTIGVLGRFRAGRALIDFLGHMRADARLGGTKRDVRFNSPVGLSWKVDPEGRATAGLARFGAGCIEVGPVTLRPRAGPGVRRDPATRTVLETAAGRHDGLRRWQERLARAGACSVPRWVRLAAEENLEPAKAAHQLGELAAALAPFADLFVVAQPPPELQLPVDRPWLAEPAAGTTSLPRRAAGVVVEVAAPVTDDALTRVAAWRAQLGPEALLVVRGGHEPVEIRELLAHGADVVLVDAGLVFTGPGLVKRANLELLAERFPDGGAGAAEPEESAARLGWFWGAVLGTALCAGGALALGLAFGRVLLPYDEHHLGLGAAQLARLQPRLHDFMAHDRATLAGTMLGLGAFYGLLARGGVRRDQHWAQTALNASALVGFGSFFAFLGFGYFDPFHAFVTAALLQLALPVWWARPGATPSPGRDWLPETRETPAWRRAQWGQLLFVVHAVGLLVAGGTILAIGMSRVFVGTDLDFLCATPAELAAFNTRLLGVVAHDRATLGGMLLSCGVAQLLATLWGFRRGRGWLWTALLALGAPAYGCAIGIHVKVGYTSAWHLAPAFVGAALWVGGLALTRRWLGARDTVGARQG